MKRLIPAAALYFALVFAAGFVLGALRVFLLEPRIGEVPATFAELPVMLLVSWLAARHAVKVFRIEARLAARLGMGLLAFALLIGAEFGLGAAGFGRSLDEAAAEMLSPKGLIGLAGQILFALFPAALLLGRR